MEALSLTPIAIYEDLERIRSQVPLIHNITNFVVMQQTANALLALGASPLMAHAIEEIADIVKISNALVINIGTLDSEWIASMLAAFQAAKNKKIPIILDPVGAGASKLRTDTARNFLKLKPSVIRGNASEILALYADGHSTKGVDSLQQSNAALLAAREIAKRYECIVVISGATDFIIDAKQQLQIHNGTPLLTRITGMGCTATAFIAAFCAVNLNYFQAAAAAMAVMGIVGEIAAACVAGPGSLQYQFNDVVYQLTLKEISAKLRINDD